MAVSLMNIGFAGRCFQALLKPTIWIKLLVLCLLVFLVGLPLWQLVWGSFHVGSPFNPGDFTLENYQAIFADTMMPTLVINTLIFAAASTCVAMFLGVCLAWLATRTDLPGARIFHSATLAVLLIPMLIGAMAWSILLAPNTGLLNLLFFEPFFGWRFNAYSMSGMVWVQSLYTMPIVFVLMAAAFQRMDPEMEAAARVVGSGRFGSFFNISLGVARPALLSAAVIVFVIGIESIEIPLIFGFPGKVFVLAGDVYRALRIKSPAEWGLAATLSVLLILAVTIIFAFYGSLTRRSYRFVTVGGRGRSSQRIKLGRWRWPTFILVFTFFLVTLGLPLLAVIYASTVDYFGQPSIELLHSASLKHYAGLVDNPLLLRAVGNSFILAIGAGLAVLIVSTIIATMSVRSPSRLSKINDSLSLLPLAVPSIALASAILWAYIQLPAGVGRALFGSLLLIGLAYVTKFMPVVVRQISAQLMQLSPDLEYASRVSGANHLRTTLRVTAPLLSPALGSAFFLAFVLFFREFSISILLFQNGSEVFSVAMFGMYTDGQLGQVGAATVILVTALLILMTLSNCLLKTQKPANTFR